MFIQFSMYLRFFFFFKQEALHKFSRGSYIRPICILRWSRDVSHERYIGNNDRSLYLQNILPRHKYWHTVVNSRGYVIAETRSSCNGNYFVPSFCSGKRRLGWVKVGVYGSPCIPGETAPMYFNYSNRYYIGDRSGSIVFLCVNFL